MHPGANVALDLLLWMALFVTGFFATLAAAQDILGLGYSSYYYNGTTTTQDYQSQRSNGVVTAVGAAFTFLALYVLHTILSFPLPTKSLPLLHPTPRRRIQ